MNGRDFLDTARFLLNDGKNEAAYRSAISRAYYACFHVVVKVTFDNCEQAAKRKGGIKNRHSIMHKSLVTYFKDSGNEEIRRIGEDLDALRGNREEADYKLEKPIFEIDSKGAIEEAEFLLDCFSKIEESDIGNAMASYYNKIYK